MADADFDDYGGYGPPAAAGGGRMTRIINIAGAASSVVLIIGLAVWGYKIAVRDVNGVPVIRAMEGPMRIAPDDPGGAVTANQGLAVNAVAAAGGATPPADRLVLAPRSAGLEDSDAAGLSELPPLADPAPMLAAAEAATAEEPAPEELAQADLGADLPVAERVVAAAPAPARTVVPVAQTAAQPAPPAAPETPAFNDGVDRAAVASALADALAEGAEPLGEVQKAPAGALVRSLRPPARPANRTAQAAPREALTNVQQTAAVAPAAPAAAVPAEVEAASLKPGSRLVQLGAFDTADQARGDWQRLRGRFPELLASKSLVVQSGEAGGRTFFRLRASGFDGEDDARRFCTALLAEGAACIPVVQR